MKLERRVISAITFGSLLFVTTVAPASSWAPPLKQANAGDSISQGFGANGWPGDHPDLSWVQGTDDSVDSTAERLGEIQNGFTQEPQSVTGAEMVGGNDSFAAQASRICAESVKPTRVRVLLGGNDVCNRPKSDSDDATENMYSVTTWTNALRAGLDQLADCLPPQSVIQVMSMPRVDGLYEAGHDKSWWCYYGVWPLAGICRIVTNESDAGRRAQIGARVDEYNDAIATEMQAYSSNANGKNPKGMDFITDWEGSIDGGHANTSIGTFSFTAADINGVDCFHPNTSGQARLACIAWTKSPDGAGPSESCFAR
jgi:lysophospholipase L1-like esterase